MTISSLNAVEFTCEATWADTPVSGDDVVHMEDSTDLHGSPVDTVEALASSTEWHLPCKNPRGKILLGFDFRSRYLSKRFDFYSSLHLKRTHLIVLPHDCFPGVRKQW